MRQRFEIKWNKKAYFIEDLTAYIKPDQIGLVDDETRDILVASASVEPLEYGIEVVEEKEAKG